jgi:hypothetical protein
MSQKFESSIAHQCMRCIILLLLSKVQELGILHHNLLEKDPFFVDLGVEVLQVDLSWLGALESTDNIKKILIENTKQVIR